MHLTASVYTIQSMTRTQESTIAAITFVNQRVTAGCTFDHRVQIVDTSFRSSLPRIVLFQVSGVTEIYKITVTKTSYQRNCSMGID